jgi:hypothetical protein
MPVRLNGSTSGYTELSAPAVAGNNSIALPTGNGSAYQILRNGATAGSLEYVDNLVLGTAQASTSGTSIDFTGIPSWVKRVTVILNGVSTGGSTDYVIQIGSGSVITTGYSTQRGYIQGTTSNAANYITNGIVCLGNTGASAVTTGHIVITNISSNTWVASATYSQPNSSLVGFSAGSIALSGTLDRVRITTNNPDTFDAGSINILYE